MCDRKILLSNIFRERREGLMMYRVHPLRYLSDGRVCAVLRTRAHVREEKAVF